MHAYDVQLNTSCEITPEVSEAHIREIVNAVLAGETERFGEIFNLFHKKVYALAWNITGDYDDAMDVVQECFLRTFRALSSWRGRAKFSTWLHRIAVNTAIDYIRRQSKHYVRRLTPTGEEEQDDKIQRLAEGIETKTPATELERKELRQTLMRAIAQLRGRQRKCFLLRYFADLPIKEVAQIVGCGEGTVKRHLFRARKHLRQILMRPGQK